MSIFSKFLTGMSFRTTTPTFAAGEEIEVYVTELDEESGELVAQVGETRLHFENGETDIVGCRVLAKVESSTTRSTAAVSPTSKRCLRGRSRIANERRDGH